VEWAREMEPGLRHLVVAGGVACNQHVRAQLTEVAAEGGVELVLPPPRWCTDNGVMVAWAGAERLAHGWAQPPPAAADPAEGEWVDLRPRWPLTSERHPRSMDGTRSQRKERIHTSLSDLTAAGLGALGGEAAAAAQALAQGGAGAGPATAAAAAATGGAGAAGA
jgi:N6-L-threonylcarbamoyladenine synthase